MTESLIQYLHLDQLWAAVAGYVTYRYIATRCFFEGPRLGHPWEGNDLVRLCSRCPKQWIGSL